MAIAEAEGSNWLDAGASKRPSPGPVQAPQRLSAEVDRHWGDRAAIARSLNRYRAELSGREAERQSGRAAEQQSNKHHSIHKGMRQSMHNGIHSGMHIIKQAERRKAKPVKFGTGSAQLERPSNGSTGAEGPRVGK